MSLEMYYNKVLKMMKVYTVLLVTPYFIIMCPIFSNEKSVLLNAMSICFLLVLFMFILVSSFSETKKISINGFILGAFFCLVMVIGIFFDQSSTNLYELLYNVSTFVSTIYFMLIFCLCYDGVISEGDLLSILSTIVGIALCACLYNLIINYHEFFNLMHITNAYQINLSGFFTNRNEFGAFLYFALICNFILLTRKKEKKNLVYAIIILLNVICTLCRAAILATLVFVTLYFFTLKKEEKIVVILMTSVFITLIFLFPMSHHLLRDILIRPDAGSAGRIDRWLELLNYLSDNISMMFLGMSPSGFKFLLVKTFRIGEIDNMYLELLFTGGMIKLLFYIAIIINSIKIAFCIKRYDQKMGIIFIGIIISYACLVCFMTVTLLESGLIPWIATLLVIIIPRFYFNSLKGINENTNPYCLCRQRQRRNGV